MSIIGKIFMIIYFCGIFITFALAQMGKMWFPFGDVVLIFLAAPLAGIAYIVQEPYLAIPYYIVALSLLYWWEKRKRNVKVETKNVV
jgi:hypothetical protein